MILKTEEVKEGKNIKYKNSYLCNWCGQDFDRVVGSAGERKAMVSSQVNCPRCGNFIKTWE
jgi:DNA-directed RNA polymerase subunit RPC12/RpoP